MNVSGCSQGQYRESPPLFKSAERWCTVALYLARGRHCEHTRTGRNRSKNGGLSRLWRIVCVWCRGWAGDLLVHAKADFVDSDRERWEVLLSGVPGSIDQRGKRSGSMRMASRLLQEKHFSAALSHGSQSQLRCSSAESLTDWAVATCSEKTCSVFRVTPGA